MRASGGFQPAGTTFRVDSDPAWLPLGLDETHPTDVAHPTVALAMTAADGTASGRFIVAWNAREAQGDINDGS